MPLNELGLGLTHLLPTAQSVSLMQAKDTTGKIDTTKNSALMMLYFIPSPYEINRDNSNANAIS